MVSKFYWLNGGLRATERYQCRQPVGDSDRQLDIWYHQRYFEADTGNIEPTIYCNNFWFFQFSD